MGLLRLLFSFFGRINRAKFWLGLAIIYAWWGAVMATWYAVLPHDDLGNGTVGVLMIGGCVSFFAVFAKRLHDLGQTAWWIVLGNVALAIEATAKDETLRSITSLLLFTAVIALGSAKGQPGVNKFGPDPLEGKRGRSNRQEQELNRRHEIAQEANEKLRELNKSLGFPKGTGPTGIMVDGEYRVVNVGHTERMKNDPVYAFGNKIAGILLEMNDLENALREAQASDDRLLAEKIERRLAVLEREANALTEQQQNRKS